MRGGCTCCGVRVRSGAGVNGCGMDVVAGLVLVGPKGALMRLISTELLVIFGLLLVLWLV